MQHILELALEVIAGMPFHSVFEHLLQDCPSWAQLVIALLAGLLLVSVVKRPPHEKPQKPGSLRMQVTIIKPKATLKSNPKNEDSLALMPKLTPKRKVQKKEALAQAPALVRRRKRPC